MPLYDLVDDMSIWPLEEQGLSPLENMLLWKDRWFDTLQGRSNATIRAYDTVLNGFLDWVELHEDIPLSSISARYINRYFIDYQLSLAKKRLDDGHLSQEEYNRLLREARGRNGLNDAHFTVLEPFQNTLSHRLTIIKMFLTFITESNVEQHDYTKLYRHLVKIRITEKLTDYLTPSELHEVIEYMQIWPSIHKDHFPKSSQRYAYRNAMMLILYAATGARGQEAVQIRLQDIREQTDRQGRNYYIIQIHKGKGSKKRTVTVPKSHLQFFVEYFERELPDPGYYFSSLYKKGVGYVNKPMNVDHLRNFSNMVLQLLGIDKRGLHAYRRGYVTKRIGQDRVDVSIVAKEVGNTSAILEKHYLKHSAEAFLHLAPGE